MFQNIIAIDSVSEITKNVDIIYFTKYELTSSTKDIN